MIYDSLDILPIKLYYRIDASNEVKLLALNEEVEENNLVSLWAKLKAEFTELDKSDTSKKIFRLSKQISDLEATYHAVLMSCESLGFEYDEKLIQVIRDYGFKFDDTNTKTYYDSIEKVIREAKSYVVKINRLKDQLPKNNDNSKSVSLDEIMAGYSNTLGFDFDYNSISCTKFFALKNQVANKLKAIEKQIQNVKSHGKR